MTGDFRHHMLSSVPGRYGRQKLRRFRKAQDAFRLCKQHIDSGDMHMTREIEKVPFKDCVVQQVLFQQQMPGKRDPMLRAEFRNLPVEGILI